MKLIKAKLPSIAIAVVSIAAFCVGGAPERAQGELRWQIAKRQTLRIRLVALEAADRRSSFFSSHEVFVAAQQMGPTELRLVKLVYEFLPYQPRLSDSGFDYATLHEIMAVRDPSCDETLSQMTSTDKDRVKLTLQYATDSPDLDMVRRRSALPCYETSATDYSKGLHEPADKDGRF
jgi:hypothetical protein